MNLASRPWIELFAGAAGVLFAVVLYLQLAALETRAAALATEEASEAVLAELEVRLEDEIAALDRMAARYNRHDPQGLEKALMVAQRHSAVDAGRRFGSVT